MVNPSELRRGQRQKENGYAAKQGIKNVEFEYQYQKQKNLQWYTTLVIRSKPFGVYLEVCIKIALF